MNPSTGVSIMTSLCRVKMNRALKRSGGDTLDVGVNHDFSVPG